MGLRADNARGRESFTVWVALMVCAFLVVWFVGGAASIARGEEQSLGSSAQKPRVSFHSETWSMYLLKAGEDRRPVFGARMQLNAPGPLGSGIFARLDANAMPANGQPVAVSLDQLSSADTFEAYIGGYRDVIGPLALAAFAGTAVPLQGGTIVPGARYPAIGGAGLLVGDGTGDRWALVAIGTHEAAGKGSKFLATWHYRLTGRTSFVGDTALGGEGGFTRLGLSVCLLECGK